MSYRVHLVSISKETQDKFSGYKSYYNLYNHLEKNYERVYPTRLPGAIKLAEIMNDFSSSGTTHTLKEVYSFSLDEEEYYYMSKDNLKDLIEYYRKNILLYYEQLIDRDGNFLQDERNIGSSIRGLWSTWRICPFDLDSTDPMSFISRSYRVEYDIFNLVYIYKTFNWDKDYLLYVGG